MALGKVLIEIGLDGAARFEGDLQKGVARAISGLGRTLKRLGTDLTQTVTAPIAGLATAAFRFSTEASAHFKRFGERAATAMGKLGTDISRSINLEGRLEALGSFIEKAVRWFEDLGPNMKSFVVNLALFAAAAGPVVLFGGKILSMLGGLVAILSGPLGVIALIGAAAVALVGLYASLRDASSASTDWRGRLTEEERALASVNKRYAEEIQKLKELEIQRERIIDQDRRAAIRALPPAERERAFRGMQAPRGGAGAAAVPDSLNRAIAAQQAAVERTLPTLESLVGRTGITGFIQDGVDLAGRKITEFMDGLEVRTFETAALVTKAWRKSQVEVIDGWNNWVATGKSAMDSLKSSALDLFTTFTNGFASAIGQALILGQDFGTAMSGVFASVAQAGINMIVQILFQWVAAKITEIVTGAVAAHSSIPFVGIAIGLAAAAAGIAGARALASKEGGHAFAEGGLVTGPVMGLLGEAGSEVVLPLRPKLLERLGIGGGAGRAVQLVVDGRVLAEALLPHHGRALRFHGVPG